MNKEEESIIVPLSWIEGLVERAKLAEKSRENNTAVDLLIGYSNSAKTIIKYGKKI